MDRYPDLMAYHAAKQRIYRNARSVVYNRAEPLTRPLLGDDIPAWSFGENDPDIGHYGIRNVNGQAFLARGLESFWPVSELGISGRHNALNALAATAIAVQMGVSFDDVIPVLRRFMF